MRGVQGCRPIKTQSIPTTSTPLRPALAFSSHQVSSEWEPRCQLTNGLMREMGCMHNGIARIHNEGGRSQICKKKINRTGKIALKGGHPGSEGQAAWFLSCAKVSRVQYMYQGRRNRGSESPREKKK